jgi:hypothetical protein
VSRVNPAAKKKKGRRRGWGPPVRTAKAVGCNHAAPAGAQESRRRIPPQQVTQQVTRRTTAQNGLFEKERPLLPKCGIVWCVTRCVHCCGKAPVLFLPFVPGHAFSSLACIRVHSRFQPFSAASSSPQKHVFPVAFLGALGVLVVRRLLFFSSTPHPRPLPPVEGEGIRICRPDVLQRVRMRVDWGKVLV